MRRVVFILIAVWLVGCSGTAILPAKVTYTYPLGGPSGYESPAGTGAVAYLDNGTLELYLPLFKPGQLKPERFVFRNTDEVGAFWAERKDPEFKARMILQTEQIKSPGGSILAQLNEGMILFNFPAKSAYGDLAGKQIWLTSTVGPEEVYRVRGIYLKSKASFADLAK